MTDRTVDLTVEEASAVRSLLKIEMTIALTAIFNQKPEESTSGDKLSQALHNITLWNRLDRVLAFRLATMLETAPEVRLSTVVSFKITEPEYEAIAFVIQNGQWPETIQLSQKEPRLAVPATVIINKNLARLKTAFQLIPETKEQSFTFAQKAPNSPLLN